MSKKAEEQLKETGAVIDRLLHSLAALGITPRPPQLTRPPRELCLPPSELSQSQLAFLGNSSAFEVQQNLQSRLQETKLVVQGAYRGVVKDWRGPVPSDGFESIATSFEKLYLRQAEQMKAEVEAALERHRQFLVSRVGPDPHSRDNRFRTDVKKVLEEYFEHKPCPSPAEKRLIAETTNLSVKQVTTWFANQRSRKGKVIRKLAKRPDARASEMLAPTPILEEPEPMFDFGMFSDSMAPLPPAPAAESQIEGAVSQSIPAPAPAQTFGRASPVPSLSSSISSSNDSSEHDKSGVPSVLDLPLDGSPPSFAPVDFEAEPAPHMKTSSVSAPAMITPAEWSEMFPDLPSGLPTHQPERHGVDPFPRDTLSTPTATSFFSTVDSNSAPSSAPADALVKDPFAFSGCPSTLDVNMAAATAASTPGVDYWDNLLQTLSEENSSSSSSGSCKDVAEPAASGQPQVPGSDDDELGLPSTADAGGGDWTEWSEWAMPVLEGFEAQSSSS